MPRQGQIAVTNNFNKGLVTTASPLSFPENACTQTSNCIFTLYNSVDRRGGLDVESTNKSQSVSNVSNQAYSEFLWTNVGGIGNKTWLVVQHYQTLYFYDLSTSTQVGSSAVQTMNLPALATGCTGNPGLYQCQFAEGNGYLYITNPLLDPFFLTYNIVGNTVSATTITLQTRDLFGLPESFSTTNQNTYRPTVTLANCPTTWPNHYYNLYNQGWGLTTALSLWAAGEAYLPSNCDYTALYRSSPTVPWTSTYLATVNPGNTIAAKGHYILTEFNKDYSGALVSEGYTAIAGPGSYNNYSYTIPTVFADLSNGWASLPAASDGDISPSTGAYFTLNFATTPSLFVGLNMLSNLTFTEVYAYFSYSSYPFAVNNWQWTFQLYGSNTLPTSGTSGTLLSTVNADLVAGTQLGVQLTCSAQTYQYVWIYATASVSLASQYHTDNPLSSISGSDLFYVNEIQIAAPGSANYTIANNTRPSTVAWYAGRVFYSGQQGQAYSSNVYFSQILEPLGGVTPIQAGYCYQNNDPTCEQVADLLSDDGGIIQIQDMGVVRKLFPFKSSLLVFASNGLWCIEGAGGQGFAANNYLVRKLSAIGCVASNSIVNYKGAPLWWAEDGIYTVNYNANYDSYDPSSISLEVINEFYQGIPIVNRQYAKGGYDTIYQTAYWLYNDGTDINLTQPWSYNAVLLLNGMTGAFYPWKLATVSDTTGPTVHGIMFIQDGQRILNPVMKYVTSQTVTGNPIMYFSDTTSGLYYDWTTAIGASQTYSSSFTTAYRIDGKTQLYFQPGYVMVFFAGNLTTSQCAVQAWYDFAFDQSTNKFSTAQYAYPTYINAQNSYNPSSDRVLNYKRMKIRGKGRALQLNFQSVDGQPFSIYGWSFDETASSQD